MPISFKAVASSATVNATFLDKTINDTMGATLTLDDTDLVSGDAVGNAQLSINRNTNLQFSEVLYLDGDVITLNNFSKNQDVSVVGNAAPITLDVVPFGNFGLQGLIVTVLGGDDTNTVKLVDNRATNYGCVLNGSATLGLYDVLTLKFNLEKLRYIEIARNF